VTNSTASTYVWYRNNVVVYSGNNTVYTATTAGVYKMRAQLGSCGVFSNPYTVTVPCREGELMDNQVGFSAHPNPFTDIIHFSVELKDKGPVSIVVYDMSGKAVDYVLNQAMLDEGETRIVYSGAHLAQGIYIATVQSSEGTKHLRIIMSK
jgi:hypothetical protein